MKNEETLEKIEEILYYWLMDINAGDRDEYVIGDMFIYEIIHKFFPDLVKELKKIKKNPPMRVNYFGKH